MKKIAAVLMSIAVLVCFASCGSDSAGTSSEGVSSTETPSTPVSSTPNTVISIVIPSVPEVTSDEDIVDAENLALAEGATWIDMNTGKASGDEGYKAYFGEADGTPHNLELAFDGNLGTGWQTVDKPDDSGDFWLGVEFTEATAVDMIVMSFESGSAPVTFEEGAYRLEYSVDGTEWAVIDGAEVVRSTDANTVDAAAFEAVEAKAVRVVLLAASSDGKWAPKLWELEVYAPVVEETVESTDDTAAE